MPKILYSQVIEEDPRELKELERRHRYTHLFQRVRMLRLLKSEECANLGEAAEVLGYSWRQCHRWFASYGKGGIEELLYRAGSASAAARSWSPKKPSRI
jgi:Helix-turn-helix domain